MEEAAELGNYLPLSFKSPKEQEYIAFLWDAFETNYTHGKYQFAFLAYHQHYHATDDPALTLATFSTAPAIRSARWNLTTEAIGTVALVLPILLFSPPSVTVAEQAGEIGLGSLGAIPAGLLVFGIGLSLGGPTGYAINPARDLGPRIAHALLPVPGKGRSDWAYAWVPVAGPLVGAAIAGGAALALAP